MATETLANGGTLTDVAEDPGNLGIDCSKALRQVESGAAGQDRRAHASHAFGHKSGTEEKAGCNRVI